MMDEGKSTLKPEQYQQIALGIMIFGLIGGILFYLTVYSDLDPQIHRVQRQISKARKTLRDQELKLKNLNQIIKQVSCLDAQIKQIEAHLPRTEEDLDQFLGALNKEVREAGLEKMLRFEIAEQEEGDLFMRIPVEIEFLASYESTKDFFWKLSEMDGKIGGQIVNITDVVMVRDKPRSKDQDENKHLLHVSCVVETYLYIPPDIE